MDRKQRWVLFIVCLSVLVISIDSLILNVALPTLVRALGLSTSELQWIVDAYLLTFAGFLLMGGTLGDRFGRALVLRIGLVAFGISSVAAAITTSGTVLVLCRGVMGIGAALIMPTSVGILANVFTDARERGRVLGVWAAAAGLGLCTGPILGGVLLSQFWWGSVFLVNVPLVVVALVVSWWAIPESRDSGAARVDSSRLDPLGVVLSTLAVSGLVWATIQAPTRGWGSAATLGSFAGSTALLACFVVWELRCAHPMLELQFFRDRRFSVANLASGTAQFAFAGTIFVLTQLLQSVSGYSPLAAGIRLVPFATSFMVAGLLGPRLAEYIGTKRAVALGLGIFAAGMAVIAFTDASGGGGLLVVAMLAIGCGYGFTTAPTTDAVVGAVPRHKAGMAFGTLSTGRQIGQAAGVAVLGSLSVSGYRSELAAHTGSLGLSAPDLTAARTSVEAALAVAHRLGGETGHALGEAARGAFTHGVHLGVVTSIVILVIGAVLALRYLPARVHTVLDGEDAIGARALEMLVD